MDRTRGNQSRAPREGSSERSGGLPSRGNGPDPEVLERATRRRFTAEYKQRILRDVEACREQGAIGRLLRSEGLYSSHLVAWRKQLQQHGDAGLAGRRRGPTPQARSTAREIQLEREKRQLEKRLAKAEAIIEFQKKVHGLLAIPLKPPDLDEDD